MTTFDVTSVLDAHDAHYELLPHARTERALDEARAVGARPDEVVKTIVLGTPSGNVRAVIPADARLDLKKVAQAYGESRKHVHLMSEDELATQYHEFELGAVPPVGGRHRDVVILDRRVALADSVVLEAGTHEESVRVRTDDLIRITDAFLADIALEE